MKYRNTVTGVVIDIKSRIAGGNWQAEESANFSIVKEDLKELSAPSKRKASKKKDE